LGEGGFLGKMVEKLHSGKLIAPTIKRDFGEDS